MKRSEILKYAKPILFNTEMVQAILDGRKTVTRRVIKPQPKNAHTLLDIDDDNAIFLCGSIKNGICSDWEEFRKLKYKVGDILYVRETWHKDIDRYMYKANYTKHEKFYMDGNEIKLKWKPSIHMPKEAARIFLKVTDVRVEKLQDIKNGWKFAEEGIIEEHGFRSEMANEFIDLWDGAIKKQNIETFGWDANPYVWVYEFERVVVDCE